jgi:hypothetical protein
MQKYFWIGSRKGTCWRAAAAWMDVRFCSSLLHWTSLLFFVVDFSVVFAVLFSSAVVLFMMEQMWRFQANGRWTETRLVFVWGVAVDCFSSLLGFISSLPQLAWDKRLCCCCCCCCSSGLLYLCGWWQLQMRSYDYIPGLGANCPEKDDYEYFHGTKARIHVL